MNPRKRCYILFRMTQDVVVCFLSGSTVFIFGSCFPSPFASTKLSPKVFLIGSPRSSSFSSSLSDSCELVGHSWKVFLTGSCGLVRTPCSNSYFSSRLVLVSSRMLLVGSCGSIRSSGSCGGSYGLLECSCSSVCVSWELVDYCWGVLSVGFFLPRTSTLTKDHWLYSWQTHYT